MNWNQEIKFLEKIDHFRFLEYVRIPAIETTLQGLGYNSSQKIKITKTKFKSYFVLLNTQVIEVITGEKSTFIAMASVDSPVFNDQAMQLLSLLLDNRRSMVVAEEDLFIYKQSENFKVMAWSRFCKMHPAQAEAALRRVKEACGRMEKELVKSRKIVDDRKQDISSIILGSIN